MRLRGGQAKTAVSVPVHTRVAHRPVTPRVLWSGPHRWQPLALFCAQDSVEMTLPLLCPFPGPSAEGKGADVSVMEGEVHASST